MVWADERALKRVLVNLVSNALKFTPEGGTVTVTARAVRGPEGKGRSAEYVEIAVADTGIGITAEDLPKLFQPFQRLHLRKHFDGTGLIDATQPWANGNVERMFSMIG